MKSREQLIAQMLEDEPDDGDRTITSHYLDGATTATKKIAKANTRTSTVAGGRQTSRSRPQRGGGDDGGPPKPATANNGRSSSRRFFEGHDAGGSGSGRPLQRSPPVSELEIRADAVSVCTELTDPTTAAPGYSSAGAATVAFNSTHFDNAIVGSQRHCHRSVDPPVERRGLSQPYGAVSAHVTAIRVNSQPSATESSWTEISDDAGEFDVARGDVRGSKGGLGGKNKTPIAVIGNKKTRCRRFFYLSCASLLFVVVAAGIVFAVWRQPIVAAAQGVMKRFNGGGEGSGSGSGGRTEESGATDRGGAQQGQGNGKESKDDNLRRRLLRSPV